MPANITNCYKPITSQGSGGVGEGGRGWGCVATRSIGKNGVHEAIVQHHILPANRNQYQSVELILTDSEIEKVGDSSCSTGSHSQGPGSSAIWS